MVYSGEPQRARQSFGPLLLLAGLFIHAAPALADTGCSLSGAGETAIVTAVSSADTLSLETGETVVLSSIRPPESGAITEESWPPRAAARLELDRLASGKAVRIAPGRHRLDRYGNRLGQVYVVLAAGGDPVWVQGELVASGQARTSAIETDEPCLADLLALEAAARADKRGNWATGLFADHDAGEVFTLRRLHDTFQAVTGIVDSIDQGHGPPALILRSAVSAKDASKTQDDDGLRVELPDIKGRQNRVARSENLAGLLGRRVRVRGWIEGARRARISLADPLLIEVLEPPEASTAAPEQK